MRRVVIVAAATAVVLVLALLVVRTLALGESPSTVAFKGALPLNPTEADRLRIESVARPKCHPDRSSWEIKLFALSVPSYVAVQPSSGPALIYECRTGAVHGLSE